MNIIGKNSLSLYIAYVMYFIFILFICHFVYDLIAQLILWYKYNTGSTVFSNTFILSKDIGWEKNQWTLPIDNHLKFRINYPFTKTEVNSGLYPAVFMIIHNLIGLMYCSLFFFFSYKFFKEMTSEVIFNKKAISWLRKLGFLNLLLAVLGIFELSNFNDSSGIIILTRVFIGIFGMIMLFIVEFFKKGIELQNENDLTI
ncbi:DUF2975 domain-containing protein [Chryseobacterium sp.]|uniref:DUF2975 domain-containing protein n=1 Tax=Chryseobacterium sp. TaxID=1871047 RepID=UPI00289E77B5|nr:DUF2975 domain-containing protein [Chryseobacterium sp.]